MKPFTCDSHRYTKLEIEALRADLIRYRGESMHQWPEAIPFTTLTSHIIAFMAHCIEEYPEDE